MTLTIKGELRRTFELAMLRKEVKALRTSRHLAQANNLILRSRALREREARLFAERYDTRVEIARRRLIDEAATPTRTLQPSWARPDRFHPADLLRQAQREVRAHHERRINRIKEAEARSLASLVRQAERDNGLRIFLIREFGRAVDPPDGRGPPNRTGPTRR